MEALKKVFGIDLGTTYSCICYVDEFGKPVTVPNAENERVTPSVVFFDGAKVIVGKVAKECAQLYPKAVVEMVKRSMGDPNYLFAHEGKNFRPEEISHFILRKVVGDAEQNLGEKITDVVITCPAYFGVSQREATAAAGTIAGLNVRAIINEPTAAALAYGLKEEDDQVVLVYDLGGGTFDITMIEVQEKNLTVLCTGGDHHLGGRDWDTQVVKHLAQQFQDKHGGGNILDDAETLQELYTKAEEGKKTLSQRDMTPFKVQYQGQTARVELTRDKFDELTAPLLESTITLTRTMLSEAAAKGHKTFAKILLVGGSTRMPQIQKRLTQEFPGIPAQLYDPDEAVAKGAALYAWKLAIDEATGTVLGGDLDKATEQAKEKAREIVAETYGLPANAIALAGTTVRNVTSKTFGIVAIDPGNRSRTFVSNLICRNDPVPADVAKEYVTLDDNQKNVLIELMENTELGDKAEIANSTKLGEAELDLPPGLPAKSKIVVRFRLTEQGRLEVEAAEPRTGKTVSLPVETASVMSAGEVKDAKTRGLAIPVS